MSNVGYRANLHLKTLCSRPDDRVTGIKADAQGQSIFKIDSWIATARY
jgi:hypothetical protein